ncbi:aminoglycoside phosphotransferase [Xylanibacillus composti]|uniref:Aminoglycoside phosphotransferase n=1 Tax=Xylanibacillus composti TaxID=1572762 RepID=A0A8J4H1G1_9BACL|nr:aminoglycoside phosphotransferase family protein [Xylanibacillus composti]MDT9725370.1 aminoglycoside phosphotransferase [Xylanibacillus composti]GIQ69134.1 aminoglycoside phosphotransferase [Xylanibacillus composti]
MKKGKLIGKGRTAEVYAWGEQRALKLYYPGYAADAIRREAEIGQIVREAGVAAPRVYELMEESGRRGLIYERIPGSALAAMMRAHPRGLFKHAREMARLHHRIHSCSSTKLPRQKDKLEQSIREGEGLLKENTATICSYLHALPEGRQICHGDLHPDNILVTADDYVAVDWSNATIGDPLCDVARTSLIFLSPANLRDISAIKAFLERQIRRWLNRAYIREYCRLAKVSRERVDVWILPVAAARLQEQVPGERKWLLRLIQRRMKSMAAARAE